MGFIQKIWTDRSVENPTRYQLSKEDGSTELVTLDRSEGNVSAEGDALNSDTFNDFESRIKSGFDAAAQSMTGLVARLPQHKTVSSPNNEIDANVYTRLWINHGIDTTNYDILAVTPNILDSSSAASVLVTVEKISSTQIGIEVLVTNTQNYANLNIGLLITYQAK